MNGAILLARSILESEVFASQKMLKIWIWCLCRANYKDKFVSVKTGRGETTVKLKRGEFIFGRFTAEETLNIDGSTIYKIIKKLEVLGNLTIKSNSHYSIISICNYDTYQNVNTYKVTGNEQATNNQVTSNEQASNTENKDNKDNNDNKKNKYADFVFLKSAEYETLVRRFGEGNAKKCIETLNNYKGSKGKKYKSDYLAILSWVTDKLNIQEIGKARLVV